MFYTCLQDDLIEVRWFATYKKELGALNRLMDFLNQLDLYQKKETRHALRINVRQTKHWVFKQPQGEY